MNKVLAVVIAVVLIGVVAYVLSALA